MAKMQYWTTKELIYLCGRYEIEDKKELALKMNRKYTSLLQKVHALRRTGEYEYYKKLSGKQFTKSEKTKECGMCGIKADKLYPQKVGQVNFMICENCKQVMNM